MSETQAEYRWGPLPGPEQDVEGFFNEGARIIERNLLDRELQAAPALGDMLRMYAQFGFCSCFPCAAFAGLIRLGVFDDGTKDRARELVTLLDELEHEVTE